MYGVIVCGRCNLVKGVDLSCVSTTCPRCGRVIKVGRAKVYHRTEDLMELAEAVRQVSERSASDLLTLSEVSVPPSDRIQSRRVQRAWGPESIEDMMKGLDEFSEDDLAKAMEIGVEDAKELIARMLCQGDLMEPRAGRYRLA